MAHAANTMVQIVMAAMGAIQTPEIIPRATTANTKLGKKTAGMTHQFVLLLWRMPVF